MLMNFSEYTESELSDLIQQIEQERQRRKDIAQKELWREVIDAIKKYTNTYGSIEINDCGMIIDLNTEDFISPRPGIFEMA